MSRMKVTRLLLALAGAGLVATGANAQELTGTLKKIKDTGSITIGHRESSIPFSYLTISSSLWMQWTFAERYGRC